MSARAERPDYGGHLREAVRGGRRARALEAIGRGDYVGTARALAEMDAEEVELTRQAAESLASACRTAARRLRG